MPLLFNISAIMYCYAPFPRIVFFMFSFVWFADPLELQSNIEKTIRSDGESALTYLDRQMTNELNSKTSSGVINELLSEGLLKPSGKNCISLMTTSGAKGSKVSFFALRRCLNNPSHMQ